MKQCIFFLICLLFPAIGSAQNMQLFYSGEIEYEYQINQYARIGKLLDNPASREKYRNQILALQNNRFQNRTYSFKFDKSGSIFELMTQAEGNTNIDFAIGIPTLDVFTDFASDSIYIKKNVIGQIYEIHEEAVPIVWKFTDERMDILGFECRRANGILFDSVYVVAFYCPDIPLNGGPSIFGGLPGLILGVSIPQDNINIFAKNLKIGRVSVEKENNQQHKSMNAAEFRKFIASTFSSFDKHAIDFNLRTLML